MKVVIQTLKNIKYSIDVTEDQTIFLLKSSLQSQHQLGEPEEQKLIHKGKILKDDQTIGSAGVRDGDAIVIMISKKKPAAAAAAATQETPAAAAASSQSAPAPSTATFAPAASVSTAPAAAAAAIPAVSGSISSAATSNLVIGAAQEGVVTDLMSMGFERDLVVRALRAAFNNPDRAAEFLFNGTVPAAAPVQAPVAAPPAAAPASAPASSASATTVPAGAPNVAGLGAGGLAGLSAMIQSPEGQQLREMLQSNPELLPTILQQMAQRDPQLFQAIAANPQFMQAFFGAAQQQQGAAGQPLANDPAAMLTALGALSGIGAQGGAAGAPRTTIQITPEEKSQLDQLESLGFTRQRALEAWLVCDRNVELASSYLFSSTDDDDMGMGGGGAGGAPAGGQGDGTGGAGV